MLPALLATRGRDGYLQEAMREPSVLRIKNRAAVRALAALWELGAEQSLQPYLVGGAVRDLLLGRQPDDLDVALRGDPVAVGHSLARLLDATRVILRQEPATVRLILPGAKAPYLDLSPLQDGLEEDLAARDFTVNAMAAPLEEGGRLGPVVDPFGGGSDLDGRLLRFVRDDAVRRDPIRLLRAFRFVAELDCRIEGRALALIRAEAGLLSGVARERVGEEFTRLLGQDGCAEALKECASAGVLEQVVPELATGKAVGQDGYHHLDVWEHSLEAVSALEALLHDGAGLLPDTTARRARKQVAAKREGLATLKLGALLHDVAKPTTKTVESTGRVRFLGHNTVGEQMANVVTQRLCWGPSRRRTVAQVVRHHLRSGGLSGEGEPTTHALGRLLFHLGENAVEVLLASLADHMAMQGPSASPDHLSRHAQLAEHLLAEHWRRLDQPPQPRLVDGFDVMQRYGLQPGPLVGRLLEVLETASAEGRVHSEEQAWKMLDEAAHQLLQARNAG